MLDLIYISHLHRGRQKSLAYAFGLAEAFSAPLSLVSSSNLGESNWDKISIWNPNRKAQKQMPYPSPLRVKRNESFSLYLLGRPSQPAKSNYQSYQIIQRLVDLGYPILWIPYDYTFERVQNVWVTHNEPGLTDHRLKQLIAANFLPKVFRMKDHSLTRIHWNNISHIPQGGKSSRDFNSPDLEIELRKNHIDLTIYPVSVGDAKPSTIHSQGFSCIQHPILFLPLLAEGHPVPNRAAYLTA